MFQSLKAKEPPSAVVMKKIFGLSLVLILVVGIIGVATFAYLTDNETSSGNSFVSGTLDLTINDTGGVTQTLYATGMSPGATVGPSSITLKNTSTVNGATLDIVFSYTESDGSPNVVNVTADEVAAMIQVTTLDYGGSSLLGSVSDSNINAYIDIYDLKNAHLTGLSGLDAGASKSFDISVQLRNTTGSDFQADGINMTMTFTLEQ
jgi:predicted ribosomally synthesized peptide with SipW-like signal peptide